MSDVFPDFLIIPYSVRKHPEIKPADCFVYSVIYWLTKLKGERCFASNRYISEISGVKPSTARDSISRLNRIGFVKVIVNEKTRSRDEIKCNVTFGGVSLENDGGIVRKRRGVSLENEHIEKDINEKELTISIPPPNGDGHAKTSKKQKPSTDNEPMNLTEFVASCRTSTNRAIVLIGEWADEVKPDCRSKGQWRAYIRRNVRTANHLKVFSDGQISKAMERIYEIMKTASFDPTMETLLKQLTK